METSAPYTHPLNPIPQTAPASFTPIKKLLSLSWEKVQKHLLQLFLLYVMLFAAAVVVVILSAVVLFVSGAFSTGTTMTAVSMIVLLPVAFISAIIGMLGLQIATILLLAETQPALSVIGLFRLSLKKVWPLFLLSLISMFLVLGGIMVFIIPGILFSILLSMASYFLILDNLSPLQAIRRSVYVVSKNFGAVFVRMAVLFAISFIAGLIFNMISSVGDSGSILSSIASLVFNLLYGWLSIAVMMLIFQDAKRMAGDGSGKLMWMMVVAAIGWVIIVGGGFLIYRSIPAATTTIPPLELNELSPLALPTLTTTPSASIRPASASARATATPRPSATPRAATPSANP